MLKSLFPMIAALLFATAPSAWADDAKKTDKEQLQGTWQTTKGIGNGNPLPEAMIAKVKLVFSDDKMTLYPPDGDGTQTKEHTYTLDVTKTPKTLDATQLKADDGQEVSRINAIYKLDGDTLMVCFPIRLNEDRPTKFEAPADSGFALLTLKRVKK